MLQEGWNNGSDLIMVEDLASYIYLQYYTITAHERIVHKSF